MANLKDKIIVDLWVLIFGIVLMPQTLIYSTVSSAPTVLSPTVAPIMTIISLIGVILIMVFLLYCAKIKNYRYMEVYVNCTKVSFLVRFTLGITLLIAGVIVVISIKSMIWLLFYAIILEAVSMRFEKGEI